MIEIRKVVKTDAKEAERIFESARLFMRQNGNHIQWNGVYPTYGSKSLMVSDATGTDSSTDIICADTQKGEVVDKIIYINTPNSPVQIKAESYLRDYDNFKGLADHMPIVVKFSFEKTISE